ncbi:hypothetical protein RRG08_009865 [Elysia crispata]|uniref:Uncharacterized protein n=1 Tax=Elysia crispata TaxID=231223 RepID=A0AAE0Z5U9_9GAST|nr:hypothetical protein RRG08_009865 [Elysia crispata]
MPSNSALLHVDRLFTMFSLRIAWPSLEAISGTTIRSLVKPAFYVYLTIKDKPGLLSGTSVEADPAEEEISQPLSLAQTSAIFDFIRLRRCGGLNGR